MTKGVAPTKRATVWARDRVCHYCGIRATANHRTADHVWPKCRGGSNGVWNLVACCYSCNQRLGDSLDKCSCPHCLNAVQRHRLSGADVSMSHSSHVEAEVQPIAVMSYMVAELTGWAPVGDKWVLAGRR